MLLPLQYQLRELIELGPGRSVYRLGRELQLRTGLNVNAAPSPALVTKVTERGAWRIPMQPLPFERPQRVAEVMRDRITTEDRQRLLGIAERAIKGKILAFGRWEADYGSPIDWHLNPTNGRSWNRLLPWNRVLRDEGTVGDVKLTWEIGRFPQAYHLVRAATLHPEHAERLGWSLVDQVLGFSSNNQFPNGIHWNSGQEIVIRNIAWLFALHALDHLGVDVRLAASTLARRLPYVGTHLKAHFEYARRAVYNNHLIAEALGLYVIGRMFPGIAAADSWRQEGLQELNRQAIEQFGRDGTYIQNSHNYHRVALQYYMLTMRLFELDDVPRPPSLTASLERSLDFLVAHQNPKDGRLPNYGSNDGALPFVLSTCDFSDMRPTLQALSLAVRGERLYDAGPWDEESAWLLGADSLSAPLREPHRKSIHFESGYCMLRSSEGDTFGSFRCGSIRDRFSQIDMLAVDVWWRGQNVLIDGGSYLYNGPASWHDHFMRTASHNTVTLDNVDQMIHLRRFKLIYWTEAKHLDFQTSPDYTICTAEHYGYQRLGGRPIHRRSVLLLGENIFVVADTITGTQDHTARLHWLCNDFPVRRDDGAVTLTTPVGELGVSVYDADAMLQVVEISIGDEHEPRGWSSRYYGERLAVPSLTATRSGPLPITFVTIIAPALTTIAKSGDTWQLGTDGTQFRLTDGYISVQPKPSSTGPVSAPTR